MAELVVVGCGTVVPEADRGASCFYLNTGESRVLLDCGPGAVQALARLGLPWGSITDLALTHFHADHVGALPGLFFAFTHGLYDPRSEPLSVWGPVGTRRLFAALAEALGGFMLDPGFEVTIHELAPGGVAELADGTRLSTHKTPHTDESVAFRLDGGFGAFGYSGDTGRSATLGPFMADVSVFVCECSLRDHEVSDNHLSPSSVADIASAASPDLLVLSHIYPHFRTAEDVASLVAEAGYGGDVRIAHEGLRVTL